MSKVVKDLLTYLEGTKGAWQPTLSTFPETDVRQLARDLALEEKAAEVRAGASRTRDGDGVELAEREILEDVRQRARVASNDYVAQMDLYEARLRDAAVDDAAFVRIKAVAEQALTNYRGQVAEDRLPLASASAQFALVRRHFSSFVRRNGLDDFAPVVRDTGELARGWTWVAVVVALETILNGMFFATGSEMGLVGGIAEAFVLSVLNVSLAAALGIFAIRYMRHARWVWKLLAGVACIALVTGLLGLNVLIAHYREAFAAAAGASVDFRAVLDSAYEAPWGLEDPKSWMLGALGVVLGTVAAWKMHGLFDPYPGFGALAARLQEETRRYAELQRDVIQVLSDHRDQAFEDMNEIIAVLSARRHEFELALRGRERLRELFRAHLDGLERAADHLRLMFRDMAGMDTRDLVSFRIERPGEVLSSFGSDDASHRRAIETMNTYIERMSLEYRQAVDEVGPDIEEGPHACAS